MVLQYHGIPAIDEVVFKETYGTGSNTVTEGLNAHLAANNKTVRYSILDTGGYSESQYRQTLIACVQNGNPVIVMILKTALGGTLPYASESGHYVVFTGLYFDNTAGTYMAVINDLHHTYPGRYIMPFSELYSYSMNHSGYIIRAN